MNQKVPYLSRQIVYAFLIGLIAGGVVMGVLDSYSPKPLFSSAYSPSENTVYCGTPGTICEGPGGGGSNGDNGTVNVQYRLDSRNYPGGSVSGGRR